MRSRLFLALLLCASAAASAAQQTPTFRGGANYVRVDMFATTNGEPVEDLRLDELELLEDGARQQIETFEHVKVRPAGPQETRVEPNSVAEGRQMAAEARARVFVIFLDTYHTQIEGSANMRLPLVRFLDRLLGQDDLVALMTPEMSANDLTFGRKTVVISNVMQNEWTWGRRGRIGTDNDPIENLYETCFPNVGDTEGVATEMKDRRRERLTLDALDDLMISLRGLRDERKAVITVSEGWRLFTENRALARATRSGGAPAPPRIGVDPGGRLTRQGAERNTGTGVDISQCDTDRLALALMNNDRRVRDLTDTANRANVSFYTVYPRGLAVFDSPIGPDRPPSPQQDAANLNARFNNLRELAENTDGTAIVNTNDIERGLRRVVADLSSYYLLGYYSTNTRLDGRFRAITVRVKRPGVQVRARRGYRGLTADELLTSRDGAGGAPAAPSSAVNVVVNPRATFRIRTSVWAPDAANASVWVAGELDYATRKELAWTSGGQADIVVVAASGTEVATTTADVAAGEGAFALKVPVESMAAGEYAVRVRMRPKGDGALAVTDTTRLIVPAAAAALGEPVMWRRGPSTGPRHLVTADPRFTRNDRIRFEVPTAAAGTATARLLDRLGKPLQVPVQVTERADPSGAFRWIVLDATLAPLAAGDYGIEVTLEGAKQLGAFKVVP